MYRLLRPLLFLFAPEQAHHFTFGLLKIAVRIPGMLRFMGAEDPPATSKVALMGLEFPSPVGLAAGMDKNAEHIDELASIGFGFVEIGTLTPRPQKGNPRPRLFRLPKDHALINRMGFNNKGVEDALPRLSGRRTGIIVGGNIGKNKDTPNEDALNDYLACFNALYPMVNYFVVNVSSPNTPGLRELQEKGPLLDLLNALKQRGDSLASDMGSKPILLKIAPDMSDGQLDDICEVVKASGIAGIIATNTTVSRKGLNTDPARIKAIGNGGLSGAPIRARSTAVIRHLRQQLPRPLVIIGVGGIDSAEAAIDKFTAGADLVQVYTGLVYEGPALLSRINKAYSRWKDQQ